MLENSEVTQRIRFENEALETHNEFRHKHRVPPLTLSEDLTNKAFDFCRTLKSSTSFSRDRKENEYGINQFFYEHEDLGFNLPGGLPVREWYKNVKYAEYGKEPKTGAADSFYQIIWKDTKEMGIARVKKYYKHWVVALYNPPGNIEGKYTANIFKPLANASETPSRKGRKSHSFSQIKKNQSIMDAETRENSAKFAEEALQVHNEYRKQHKVPELVLNNDLINKALDFCLKIKNNVLLPNFHKDFGINQFNYRHDTMGFLLTGDIPVKAWYNYIQYAEFGTNPINLKARWFYQLVWKDTKEVGIATVNKSYSHWVVALYVPPGNISGKYPENVFKPIPQLLPSLPSPIKISSEEKLKKDQRRAERKRKKIEHLELKIKESEAKREKLRKMKNRISNRDNFLKILRRCFCIDCC